MGRRGAATISTLGAVIVMPLYVFSSHTLPLLAGAFLMGIFGAGNFGIVPGYLTERFPTMARAVGAGLTYHVGAAASSLMPFVIGALEDRGTALPAPWPCASPGPAVSS